MISTCASMRGGWIYVSIINVSTSVFLIDTFFTAIYQSTFYRQKTVPSKVAERHKSYIFCPNTASQALCVATPFHISHEGGHMMIEIDTAIIKQLYHFSGENMAHPCLWDSMAWEWGWYIESALAQLWLSHMYYDRTLTLYLIPNILTLIYTKPIDPIRNRKCQDYVYMKWEYWSTM